MKETISKTEFIQRCFREMLDDGQPHRYRDILEYIREQAMGTEFEGTIEQNNAVLAFNSCLNGPDSPYGRVRHGVYQKVSPATLQDRQMNRQMTVLHRFLDQAIYLQEQMRETHTQGCESWPDAQDRFGAIWKSAEGKVDELIDCLTAWIAETEDFDMELQAKQRLSPQLQM